MTIMWHHMMLTRTVICVSIDIHPTSKRSAKAFDGADLSGEQVEAFGGQYLCVGQN